MELFISMLILALINVSIETSREELLQLDPSLWPGHMEPFGSKQKTVNVETLDHWPDPTKFFRDYIDKNKPVLFKGLAKESEAFKLFDDDFLKSYPGSDKDMVYAEPEKKENRTKKGSTITFKEFIEKYHNESLYMVNALPKTLQKYVRMPPPLTCDDTKDFMSSQVTWFSSGGTKSVIHNDDVDNINCLFRGSQQLMFVEYTKNKKFVPIYNPQGGYSSVDVDNVNYTKYPLFRHVDQYVYGKMEEGDCLFIPYHWFHQVNSFPNEKGQNLAVNVWFRHTHKHRPKKCDPANVGSTLDQYVFSDDQEEEPKDGDSQEEGEEEEDSNQAQQGGAWGVFEDYLAKAKRKSLTLSQFVKILYRDPNLNRERVKVKVLTEDMRIVGKDIFKKLDDNKDGTLTKSDFDNLAAITDEQQNAELDLFFNKQIARIEDILEDLVEERFQEKMTKEGENESKKDEL